MINFTLFVVDDEETIRDGMATVLAPQYRVHAFDNAEAALEAIPQHRPDLILLDIGLPGMNGVEALRAIREKHPSILVIMITAYEDVQTVIEAMKLGAYDYVIKPIQMESLELSIGNALETIRLRREVQALQEQCLKDNLPFFIGESHIIQDVIALIKLVAQSPDTPILILGETGTGKELIAKAVHYRSPNFKGPMVTMNCASIPGELLESELFGYEKGAFTGASASGKRGLVEEARNGSLFLDEVGDLSLSAQAKLLRFLEEGEFYRVGGLKKIRVNTRVISATNRDLEAMMETGDFRRDLYYRLGVIRVAVPSLNQRRDDILPLARFFLDGFSRKFNKDVSDFTAEAVKALHHQEWTGNIRELRNAVERAVLIGQGQQISVQDLGLHIDTVPTLERGPGIWNLPAIPEAGIDIEDLEKAVVRHYLESAMEMAGGNESGAARLLKLNHHTFRYRLKKLREDSGVNK
ncbi:sigma-54-dependent Fis family transcriptional regulator [bacterium]|nr:sigma-54-dependent Fis family transcriptional regulator [bacterium]